MSKTETISVDAMLSGSSNEFPARVSSYQLQKLEKGIVVDVNDSVHKKFKCEVTKIIKKTNGVWLKRLVPVSVVS